MHQGKACVFSSWAYLPMSTFRRCVAKAPRRAQGQGLLVPGPVLCHGLCAADLPGILCATSKSICVRKPIGCTTWAFVVRPFRATHWPMRTLHDQQIYADFAQHLITAWLVPVCQGALGYRFGRHRSRSTPRPSICVCRCIPGHHSLTKAAIKLHTLLDLHGSIPASFTSPMARPTRSMCWTIWCSKPGLLPDGPGLSGLQKAVRHSTKLKPSS